MQFRIWTIFYVMALLGAALATFGVGGILPFIYTLCFWSYAFRSKSPSRRVSRLGHLAILLFLTGLCILILLFPAVSSSREAARRAQCRNSLKQIALSLHHYHDTHGSFPPACTRDEEGVPMHSWRVFIIPYMESTDFFSFYDLDEPWNGPKNSLLENYYHNDMYHCPSSEEPENYTNYFAVTGPQTIWRDGNQNKVSDISDGLANTILIIEVHGMKVHWLEPRDVTFEEAVELLSASDGAKAMTVHGDQAFFYHNFGLRNVAMADGSVQGVYNGMATQSIEAMLTSDGGERIDFNEIDTFHNHVWQVNWKRVYSLVLFLLIALLPLPFAIRHKRVEKVADVPGDS